MHPMVFPFSLPKSSRPEWPSTVLTGKFGMSLYLGARKENKKTKKQACCKSAMAMAMERCKRERLRARPRSLPRGCIHLRARFGNGVSLLLSLGSFFCVCVRARARFAQAKSHHLDKTILLEYIWILNQLGQPAQPCPADDEHFRPIRCLGLQPASRSSNASTRKRAARVGIGWEGEYST